MPDLSFAAKFRACRGEHVNDLSNIEMLGLLHLYDIDFEDQRLLIEQSSCAVIIAPKSWRTGSSTIAIAIGGRRRRSLIFVFVSHTSG